MPTECPPGGGGKVSGGTIQTAFEALNEHAQGAAQSIGASMPYLCLRPSGRKYVSSEARLSYSIPGLPESMRRKKNYYVNAMIMLRSIESVERPARQRVSRIYRNEYWRLRDGVSAIGDSQGTLTPYAAFCNLRVDVIGLLFLVKVKMWPGILVYPGFMSDGGRTDTDSLPPVLYDGVRSVETVESWSGDGPPYFGFFMWTANPQHCKDVPVLTPVPPDPRRIGGPPGDPGGGTPTGGGDVEDLRFRGAHATAPAESPTEGLRPVGASTAMQPADEVSQSDGSVGGVLESVMDGTSGGLDDLRSLGMISGGKFGLMRELRARLLESLIRPRGGNASTFGVGGDRSAVGLGDEERTQARVSDPDGAQRREPPPETLRS